jgi:hypothetical protein
VEQRDLHRSTAVMVPAPNSMSPRFDRYVGIDYSGAQTPRSSLKGLRVYLADGFNAPQEVAPPPSPRWYWTRRGIAEWLVDKLSENQPTLLGIGHGFSFPLAYFERYGLPLDWSFFLDDFQRHWPTDEDIYVCFVRDGSSGNGAARSGNPRWRRLAEVRVNQRTPVFRGCAISGSTQNAVFTFGRSMVGAFRPTVRLSPRFTLRFGTRLSQAKDEHLTSRTRMQRRNGYGVQMRMALSKDSSALTLNLSNARSPRWRDGFSGCRDQGLAAVAVHSVNLEGCSQLFPVAGGQVS